MDDNKKQTHKSNDLSVSKEDVSKFAFLITIHKDRYDWS